MHLIILEDQEALGQFTAKLLAEAITAFHRRLSHPFLVLGLPTGSTPLSTYAPLIEHVKRGSLSFKNVVIFNMDEYCGLSTTHPDSTAQFIKTHLLNQVDLSSDQIHLLDGASENSASHCLAYEAQIIQSGGIDLFLSGVGENGHLAFNEPYSSFGSRTRRVLLTQETRSINARFFAQNPESVPQYALTVGLGTLMDAKKLVVIATGKQKAKAVASAIEGPMTHRVPLSLIQAHPDAIILCDRAATSDLKNETLSHFNAMTPPD